MNTDAHVTVVSSTWHYRQWLSGGFRGPSAIHVTGRPGMGHCAWKRMCVENIYEQSMGYLWADAAAPDVTRFGLGQSPLRLHILPPPHPPTPHHTPPQPSTRRGGSSVLGQMPLEATSKWTQTHGALSHLLVCLVWAPSKNSILVASRFIKSPLGNEWETTVDQKHCASRPE